MKTNKLKGMEVRTMSEGGIINYGNLEKPMVAIEKVLDGYDAEERSIIISQVVARINRTKRDQQIKEDTRKAIGSFSMKSIMGLMKKKEESDEKEEEEFGGK